MTQPLLEIPPDDPPLDTGKWLPEMWEEFLEDWMAEIREDLGMMRRIKRRFTWSRDMHTLLGELILEDSVRLEHILGELRKFREKRPGSARPASSNSG